MRYALMFTPVLLFSIFFLSGSDREMIKDKEVLKSKEVEKLKDIVFNVIHEKQIKIPPSLGGLVDYYFTCKLGVNIGLDDIPATVYIPLDCAASYIANNIALKQQIPWQDRTTQEWTKFGMIISSGKGFVKDRALLFDAMELNHQVAANIEKIQKED